MQIKSLFDPGRDIHRTIEKVITYNADQEARLKAEVSEYVVTDSIEEQFERLLTRMQAAMDAGGQNEVGVWVSGFYGSGKSSFTKYLGLALRDDVVLDGESFLRHLQNRLHHPQTKALLSTLAQRFPSAVVLLDLASEMVAGANMMDVSTVLYYKVLQWAGYSRNLKVAAFERKLKKDGRFDEFEGIVTGELGVPWKDVQNDPLVVDTVLPDIAHRMYPALFKTPNAFTTETGDFVQFENERVKEMIEIVREATGKQYVVFIVDEVGQYVGSRQNLILNLDGLAKNLKSIGDGKVWIIGTAQQTLTEDDPRAALNSPELYKLKDRFPIQIDLESSDIREICYRRLLGKSPKGAKTLGDLFEKHGQALRHSTKLHDAKYYDADFDKETFANLYPFLPAHFDILLHLLGALAKSTGGIGLRSAIKVIQDILIEPGRGEVPVADRPVGWLATTVTLYDSLERDIARAFPSVHKAVGKALIRFTDQPLHLEVAKTVAVLQILGNLPVTARNVAALMHPAVDTASRRDEVEDAVKDLIADSIVPFGEKDGNLCFFSERLNDIDQERAQIPLRSMETRRIFNEALREVFSPLPSAKVDGTLAVTTGIKAVSGSQVIPLAGERETVQTLVEFVSPSDYDTARTRSTDESRQRASANTIFLLGRTASEIDDKAGEIYRCREIAHRYRNDPDQEVKEYCNSQIDRATRLVEELQHAVKRSLSGGSFIFRGQVTSVSSLEPDVLDAGRKYLGQVADQVFSRYAEAPVRADTALAEKFLKTGNLRAVTAQIDPLGLVEINGGTPRINAGHKALVSIRDYLDRNGTVDGKRLTEYFTGAPFGWSQDTLRYLVAALLTAGEIKLKVAGRQVTVNGQQAIEGLRTNNSFKTVGVSLREDRTPDDVLARAAQRLTELCGDTVLPLEEDISKAAAKLLPAYQHRFGPLAEKLDHLGLPGARRVRDLSDEIAELLLADASDAPRRLGDDPSSLYEDLKWAADFDTALKRGVEKTVRDLQRHRREIESFPTSGPLGDLKIGLREEFAVLGERLSHEECYKHAADLSTVLTGIEARCRETAALMGQAQAESLRTAQEDLQRLSEWSELTQEEQSRVLDDVERLAIQPGDDLDALRAYLRQESEIRDRLKGIREGVENLARKRRLERLDQERKEAEGKGKKVRREVKVPAAVKSAEQLDGVIRELQALRDDLSLNPDIEATIKVEG